MLASKAVAIVSSLKYVGNGIAVRYNGTDSHQDDTEEPAAVSETYGDGLSAVAHEHNHAAQDILQG